MSNLVALEQMQQSILTTRIVGTSPFIQHKWSEKAIRMIEEKQAGIKTKNREPRNPQQEFEDAAYVCENGVFGFPAGGVKACLIGAAHKDLGLEKTLLRKSLFIIPDDKVNNLVAMETSDPVMRQDVVKIGMNQTDLRYRPEFRDWAMVLRFEYDSQALAKDTILNLIQRAGFGVGLGEWRPERGGENGRFELDQELQTVIVGKEQYLAEAKAA